ncbi:hypothetical protein ALP26_01754 [Pseudomonas savastanoi pv. glycinea]|uniref:Uncharacterized protein n=1 Tax=Pseudomonas savastanoi pv. glycinea TaxID=318 RepID=A0A0P9U5N9_PSESG|nr:hypothetical protein PsgB076_13712 [Pseudomonas savastanoi pv. glycinea str. B076]EFW84726.1 hypothetical protein PsgRace4_17903 [Pseudomonas savastanoi pv. glycinea str. race 4]KPX50067.1 hypothetical protein ALO37_102681 [Pseudomonas savastanoi pv. glycinea]PYD21851.1 hypothetical protein DND36_16865 [Pseudomonas savastanoi pv. glycinea]RMM97234.1 hypothetical protein ALQ67_00635 [Pseudomonas savastanoi pv. glycinea]
MIKADHTNVPTADLVRSMGEMAETLGRTCTSLLSAAVRLAETDLDEEAQQLVDLTKALQHAEHEALMHLNDARSGLLVKLSKH